MKTLYPESVTICFSCPLDECRDKSPKCPRNQAGYGPLEAVLRQDACGYREVDGRLQSAFYTENRNFQKTKEREL